MASQVDARSETATRDGQPAATPVPGTPAVPQDQFDWSRIAEPSRQFRLTAPGYAGALMASAWVGPIVATVITVGTYLTPTLLPPWARLLSDSPALAGPLIASIAWLVIALIVSPAASCPNANSTSYSDLRLRLTELITKLQALPASASAIPGVREAAKHAAYLAQELTTAGPRWVTATGYISLWRRLHRAEEALIEVAPQTQVLADSAYDLWRMQGSTMQNSAALVADLQKARQSLQGAGDGSEPEARALVRKVRFAINDFRDERWAAIVRTRNLLYGTMVMTELCAFALLALAVIDHAPTASVVAGIVFFFLGALVGLYNRLSQQAQTGTVVQDYALSWVRLILVPMLSGLSAIGGVVLTGMLTLSGLTGLAQAGTSSAASTVSLPILADIFDLNKFRLGFLLALIFGGAPALLSNRLQQLTDQYKNDLKSTEATTSTPSSPSNAGSAGSTVDLSSGSKTGGSR